MARSLPIIELAKNRPTSANMNSSGVDSISTMGPATGIATSRISAPISPPTIDARNPTPSARAAWPCLASAWPSMAVGAEAGEPGAPSRTDVIVSEV